MMTGGEFQNTTDRIILDETPGDLGYEATTGSQPIKSASVELSPPDMGTGFFLYLSYDSPGWTGDRF
jgi:hypothetical protein